MSKLTIDGKRIGTDADIVDYKKNNCPTVEDALDALFNGAGQQGGSDSGNQPTIDKIDASSVDYKKNNCPTVEDALDALFERAGQGSSEPQSGKIDAGGSWTALGTSITYYDGENLPSWVISSGLTKGYVTRVTERINFTSVTNKGGNGHYIGQTATGSNANSDGKNAATLLPDGSGADFYTIEYGINDWGMNIPLGTMDDFLRTEGVTLDTKSFYYGYRTLLDRIYEVNPNAVIILCTTRKGHGGNYNPSPQHWYSPNGNGVYLEAFADAVIEIAKYMSLPVCDWFNESNTNDTNIDQNSWWHSWNPGRLHPNDKGSQKMANLLVHTFEKVLTNGASSSGGSSGGSGSYAENDPTVPSWAKQPTKPSYTASEVGAVPTSRTVNGKSLSDDITLSANDVGALPSSTHIPTKTSELNNDSGFITQHQSLANYYTKSEVDGKVSMPIVSLTPTNRTAAIEPNKYYLLGNVGSATAADNALTLSFSTSAAVALSFMGRFTAVADDLTLSLPSGIRFTDSVPDIVAGKTYEFNILYDVCILTDISPKA